VSALGLELPLPWDREQSRSAMASTGCEYVKGKDSQ